MCVDARTFPNPKGRLAAGSNAVCATSSCAIPTAPTAMPPSAVLQGAPCRDAVRALSSGTRRTAVQSIQLNL